MRSLRRFLGDIAYGIDAAHAVRHGLRPVPAARCERPRRVRLPAGAETVSLTEWPAKPPVA
ncbi:hypothetical protein SAMN05216266_101163 [Amycolatopsis marina]|uniref:Uncharacterized protein n=1 Tax=Amycolatopsis marina TaxID=490629 RepID=A0A1I0VDM2_9PSEU|nr:hypothetical protein SAMN05216266_101163 [Amycolatopsis marina]